ncbi:hypothetical protein RDABS01_021937 [Bienertia sinuspersici]
METRFSRKGTLIVL